VVLISVIVLLSILQAGGFKIISENLKIKFDKFNIIKGLKKLMFSINAIFELIKSIVKVIIIGFIAYYTIKDELFNIVELPNFELSVILSFMGKVFFKLAFNIIIFLLVLSVLDYIWQRYQYMKKLKMSKDEIKDEYKQVEGDPKIKGKRKQKQFEMAMSRMMSDVPKADVIITNPTHYAVALEYKYKKMASPKLIAKGKNLIAEKIKEIGKVNRIPIIENPPIARSIYSAVDINTFIPSELFKPVAEILAYIYKLKGKKVG
jgi:flagellar biosynthetic protein FlhB